MKDFQVTGEAFSPKKRTSKNAKNIFFLFFFFFVSRILNPMQSGSGGPKSIRIQIHNTGLNKKWDGKYLWKERPFFWRA
jgi:hypothetical protein